MAKNSTIEELKFDNKNFNKHTEFGMSLLEKSLRQNGAGRSILVDKDNNIIAGNGIVEAAQNAGITKTKVIEVQGDELVVVKRTDLALDSKQGREMALADNATAAADLSWDYEELQRAINDFDIDIESFGVFAPTDINPDDFFNEVANAGEQDNGEKITIVAPSDIVDEVRKVVASAVEKYNVKIR